MRAGIERRYARSRPSRSLPVIPKPNAHDATHQVSLAADVDDVWVLVCMSLPEKESTAAARPCQAFVSRVWLRRKDVRLLSVAGL